MKIKDRLTRRPESFPGQKNFPESPTIPGQDFTVQEIVRLYTRGVKPLEHYIGEDLSQFQNMSFIDKTEYLKQLASQNSLARYRVAERLRAMQEEKKTADIKEQVIAEMRQAKQNTPTEET